MGLDIQSQSLRDLASYNSTPSLDDRPSLPSIGFDISRPPSTSSQVSGQFPLRKPSPNPSVQLPGLSQLSALASIATSSTIDNHHANGSYITNIPPAMPYATAAPAATAGGGGTATQPPVCQNCATSTTPLWRRDEAGSVLCNACGLFLKLHGRPRPISLKTDVIKSRNRVKTGGQGARRKAPDANGLPAAHPDASASLEAQHRRASQAQKLSSGASERSNSPISRTVTPSLGGNPHHHSSNIAPQHLFDSVVALDNPAFSSPSLPQFSFRAASPSASSTTGNGTSHLEPPPTYDNLISSVTALKTRVSELEVINDLFRGRVGELENSEQEAHRNEIVAREAESRLRAELEDASFREADLKRRLDELESDMAEYRDMGPRQKKMRLSDIVDESRASTPLSTGS